MKLPTTVVVLTLFLANCGSGDDDSGCFVNGEVVCGPGVDAQAAQPSGSESTDPGFPEPVRGSPLDPIEGGPINPASGPIGGGSNGGGDDGDNQGCCSFHDGVAGCDADTGRIICNDGESSPTCTC